MKQQKNTFSSKLIKKSPSFWDKLSTILFIFLLAVFFIFIAFSKTYTADKVKGTSMNPTYYTGDIVYFKSVKKLNYGDVVVLKTKDKDILKRVIGLEGDTIEIKQDTGVFYVFRNGEKLDEPYINGHDGNEIKHEDFVNKFGNSVTLGKGKIFVLGDNRGVSKDSAQYGLFEYTDVLGKVDYVVENGKIPILDLFIQFFLPIFK